MFAKLVVLIALVGYASAVCQCTGKLVNQKDVWNNSSVVAHAKINKVTRPTPSLNTGNNNGQGGQNNPDEVVYEVTYVEVFKPKGSSNSSVPTKVTTPASSLDCGVPFLVQNSEYLISGNRQGNAVQITSCTSFPFMDNSVQTGPILWNVVQPELKNKLQSGQF